jgi:hypothetical protein
MLIRIKDRLINMERVSDITLSESKSKGVTKYNIRFNATNSIVIIPFDEKEERNECFRKLCALSFNVVE